MVPDPSLPIAGLDSSISTIVVGYLQTINFLGRTANLVLEAPFSDGTTAADVPDIGNIERNYSGLGDISATLTVNLIGAPSMDKEEFAALRRDPKPILGASLKVVAPTGDYDNDRVINVGANRWAARGELGFIGPITDKLLVEAKASAWVFTDNDDFLGVRRQQDPIYAVQLNLIRRFKPGFWMSLDSNFYRGGRSKIGPVQLDDLQRDMRVGASVVFPVLSRNAVKVSIATGSVNDSDESFTLFSIALQHLF